MNHHISGEELCVRVDLLAWAVLGRLVGGAVGPA